MALRKACFVAIERGRTVSLSWKCHHRLGQLKQSLSQADHHVLLRSRRQVSPPIGSSEQSVTAKQQALCLLIVAAASRRMSWRGQDLKAVAQKAQLSSILKAFDLLELNG